MIGRTKQVNNDKAISDHLWQNIVCSNFATEGASYIDSGLEALSWARVCVDISGPGVLGQEG